MPKALLLAIALLAASVALAAEPARPSIILVVVESLRRDHVGCYGYGRATTPALDRFAAEGAQFRDAVAASSWTMPSVMSLFTSQPPALHGVTTAQRSAGAGIVTLAAELRRAGYQTAGITANPMLHGRFGFAQGFDFYDDYTIVFDAGLDMLEESGLRTANDRPTGEETTRLALAWLNGKRDPARPFFLFLFYFDPHYDYLPPAPYDGMFVPAGNRSGQTGAGIYELLHKAVGGEDREKLIGLYDGEIRYTDEHVGRLLEAVAELGILDATAVVVTGDHGEEFWEHGSGGHGRTLFDEVVRVPLLVRYPARIRAGTKVGAQVSHLDLMPTLLALAGVAVPTQCAGRSLLPLLEGELATKEDGSALAGRPMFLETEVEGPLQRGARTPTQKIVRFMAQGSAALYSLADDPGEQHDLAGTGRAAEFRPLFGQFDAWLGSLTNRPPAGQKLDTKSLDPRLLQQLKSLGYAR